MSRDQGEPHHQTFRERGVKAILLASAAGMGLVFAAWVLGSSSPAKAQTGDAGLEVSKTADAPEVSAGNPIGFRIDVSNTAQDPKVGSIVVESQKLPAPGSLPFFEYTGDLGDSCPTPDCTTRSFRMLATGSQGFRNLLAPGTYRITQTDPAPDFELTSLLCDDGTSPTPSTWDLGSATATVKLDPGETVRCRFTNADPTEQPTNQGYFYAEARLAPGTQDPDFGGPFSVNFRAPCHSTDPVLLGSLNGYDGYCSSVDPGTYDVTATDPGPSFKLTSIDCDDGSSPTPSTTDLGSASATVKLDPGETVRCVLNYVDLRGYFYAEARVAPGTRDLGGDFSVNFRAPCHSTDPVLLGSLNGYDGYCSSVDPGTYDVTATDPGPSFKLTSIDCDDGSSPTPSTWLLGSATATVKLDLGETVRCMFNYIDLRDPTTAHNVTLTDELPSGSDIHWSMEPAVPGCSIAGNSLSCAFGDLTGGESVSVHVTSPTTTRSCGTYRNTAFAVADNFLQVQASASTTVVCQPATLIVEKQTLPDGDTTQFGFTGDATGTIGDGQTIVVPDLIPGTYVVSEAAAEGWDLSEISCDDGNSTTPSTGDLNARKAVFGLDAGETVVCTFTNTRQAVQTGAKTIGFWQNNNGQAIVGSYSGANCQGLRTWLNQFNPFQDLKATNCNGVKGYVANAIKNANARGASMNAMLKAQMLATALSVYFSDGGLGGNRLGAPKPIGAVTIDLTMISHMGDGSYVNVGAAFGGATSLTVSQMLVHASGQSNPGGSVWYSNVKSTQELAKDAFDAINNEEAFAP